MMDESPTGSITVDKSEMKTSKESICNESDYENSRLSELDDMECSSEQPFPVEDGSGEKNERVFSIVNKLQSDNGYLTIVTNLYYIILYGNIINIFNTIRY